MFNYLRDSVVARSLLLLSKRDRIKILIVALIQIFLGFLDLASVIIIGLLGALSISGVQSQGPGTKVKNVLDFLNISDNSFQYQCAALGIVAAGFLVIKTILSIFFIKKTLFFLANKASTLSSELFSRMLNQNLLQLQVKNSQEKLFAITEGVKLITGTVTDVSTSEIGIDKLTLSDGTEVTADLFVDCTGWKSMLLAGALKEPFKSYADILPSNRAWACQVPYVDKEKELEPYTNCTAIGHGWCWNIPLWTRLGTGYVYSDNFISPEDAKEEFKQYLMSDKMAVPRTQEQVDTLEFRDIPMRVGIHERTWVKNVVAIGLSAGFIEPLESNGLYSVHEFLLSLVSVLQRTHITQWDRDVYNSQVGGTFNTFAEFVSLHYALSIRDDTNFWDNITSKTFCPGIVDMSIKSTSNTFFDLAWRKLAVFRHNEQGGLQYVATGMHFHIMSKLQLLYAERAFRQNPKNEVDEFVRKRAILQKKWQRAAELCPSLYQYLKDNVHNDE